VLARSLHAEWTKLGSLRSTYGSLLATLVVSVGVAALFAWAIVVGDEPDAARATPADLASIGTGLGQFGLLALAALTITGEFATGSIRTTLAATPPRWRCWPPRPSWTPAPATCWRSAADRRPPWP
jgi:ABC-2 type transport system permease protein